MDRVVSPVYSMHTALMDGFPSKGFWGAFLLTGTIVFRELIVRALGLVVKFSVGGTTA